HTWSSNGRWIIYSSRRDDGNYTRPYICYFDKNGTAHKPFILPQKSTKFYQQLFKSFNVPEFMVQPVTISRRQLLKTVRGASHSVSFAGSASDSSSSSSQLSIPEIKNQIRY
ncbi:MAG: PD40 domain-containing protein, partial [Bacteroidaceae bacterium]|nr:PD40 domain-containing protein [Bacteroidaceae bacterium]